MVEYAMELINMKKIELLAPEQDKLTFKAAIENGADAIYLGGKKFSARAYATNFEVDEIIELIQEAHQRGVSVYIAVNTLVYENEMNDFIDYLDKLYLNDADAFIVQDIGLIHLIRARYPKIRLHVSTQQNVHCLDQVLYFEKLGVHRIILAREVELPLLKKICENTNVEIEVFVHGSLCVSYSGNCLHSSIIGKRSGNRGKCAQPCRMEYTLFENQKPIASQKYLLSMKDLATLNMLNQIIDCGVTSLKIEGRMKSPEYVAYTTMNYKKAILQYQNTKKIANCSQTLKTFENLFNRELTKGYIGQESNGQICSTLRPTHIGKKIGIVIDSNPNHIKIKLFDSIEQKDKIVILQKEDVSFYLSKIKVKNKFVKKAFANEIIELEVHSQINKGAQVYQCLDGKQIEEIQQSYLKINKKIEIRMQLEAHLNEKIKFMVQDNQGHMVQIESEMPIEKAINAPATIENVQIHLLKLNETIYTCKEIKIQLEPQLMIPIKTLNELRRNALQQLNNLRANVNHRQASDIILDYTYPIIHRSHSKKLKLAIKVKNIEQLKDLQGLDIETIYYDDDVTFAMAKKMFPNLHLIPVLSRIYHADEHLQEDSYLINQLGDIIRHPHKKIRSDVYLNVTNSYAVNALVQQGVERIGLSVELSKDRIQELIRQVYKNHKKIPSFEMVVYGRLQTMVMKQCFIARALGFNKKHCGSCKKNQYTLQDRLNYRFMISTDRDCNVTLYNSKRLHLIDQLDEIAAMGIEVVRLDFLDESSKIVRETVEMYLNAIHHQKSHHAISDVTYGHYFDNEL